MLLLMRIYARAPLRILDMGCWTDTPFAEHGMTWSCAIRRYAWVCLDEAAAPGCAAPFTPLWRAGLREFGVPALACTVTTDLPARCGFGVTAAVAVALTAALARLRGRLLRPLALALVAHRLAQETLGHPCGLEGHLSASRGGAALHAIAPYPRALPAAPTLGPAALSALGDRLLVVATGRPATPTLPDSLARRLAEGDTRVTEGLWRLRTLPDLAYAAAGRGDYATLGSLLDAHREAQQRLAPALHTPESRHIDAVARTFGTLGMKHNGTGGSVTLLCPADTRRPLAAALRRAGYPAFPARLAREGVTVWTE
jgi:galactokinase/mevalonate kinase-like predicted kinase